jgi:hypothetical protein
VSLGPICPAASPPKLPNKHLNPILQQPLLSLHPKLCPRLHHVYLYHALWGRYPSRQCRTCRHHSSLPHTAVALLKIIDESFYKIVRGKRALKLLLMYCLTKTFVCSSAFRDSIRCANHARASPSSEWHMCSVSSGSTRAQTQRALVKSIKEGSKGVYAHIILEIRESSNEFEAMSFCHEKTSSNKEAHYLARSVVAGDPGRQVWLVSPPEGLCIPNAVEF